MPQMAPAARLSSILEMRFSPAMSATLGNITMSLTPT